jgi:regulatory protein
VEGVVTALETQERRGRQRVNVFVDGRYAFSLQSDLAERLRVGQPLSAEQSAEILQEDERARALAQALAFLSYRPRSEREVRDRLRKKGAADSLLEYVLARLKELKYVDDEAFARYWIEQRQSHRPRGERLLRLELSQKGVDREVSAGAIEESEASEEPTDSAYRAAQRKAQQLGSRDEGEFEQKIGQFLLRRGFDYDSARRATRRLWLEVRGNQ